MSILSRSRELAEFFYKDVQLLVARGAPLDEIDVAMDMVWCNDPSYDPDNILNMIVKKRRETTPEPPPPVFKWIDIPAGTVTLTGSIMNTNYHLQPDVAQKYTIMPFQIAKYPVTNMEYEAFIDAGGYRKVQWWTKDGWLEREKNNWTQPRHWTHERFNQPYQPVVDVTWYEAVAYCRWRSAVSGEAIRLPSEAEWQRAAQGDDNRPYPWGDTWDITRCHNRDKPNIPRNTAHVATYEGRGDSPYGVVNMVGNIWEWCATDPMTGVEDVESPAEYRAIRGSSWYNFNETRVDFSLRKRANESDNLIGFRLVRDVV